MGNKCTTAKCEVVLPARKARIGVSPFPLPGDSQECFSSTRKNTVYEDKNSIDHIPNIGSLSAFSSRTRASTCDLGCEETPHLAHFNSSTDSNTNSSPTYETLGSKKLFQYKKGPLIGKGSYGEVNECLNLSSGEIIAAKSVKVYGDLAKLRNYVEALKKEILVLKSLTHPNVVKYFAIETSENKEENYSQIEIISEYVSGGSIKVLLEKFNKLDERVVSSYTKQILEGLAYLHQNEIVHRNIKSSNVLIDAYGTAKLTDFGCFKNLDKFVDLNSPEKNPKSPMKLASYWEAPEVVMKKSQGKPSDLWSVGCVVLEMLTGLVPWKNLTENLDNVCKLITSGSPPPFPEHISENCKDFLYRVFKFRPEDRPTAEELLEHPFIREQLPSLSCLDIDPQTHQIYQPSLIVRSIDLLQDDIFNDTQAKQKVNSNNTQINSNDSLIEKNTFEPSTNLGQNKTIPSQSNKSISPFYTIQEFPRSDSKQSQRENSFEIPKSDADIDKSVLPHIKQSCHFEPEEHKIRGSPSPRVVIPNDEYIRKVNRSVTYTPIRNSFFNYSNASVQKSESIKTSSATPAEKEKMRQHFEGQMLEELADVKLDESKDYKEGLRQQRSNSDIEGKEISEAEKIELRRKFEQEMEQELLNMSKSTLE